MARCFGLIPAAGTGSRFGSGVPKQYLSLAGRPMLYHSLRILGAAQAIILIFVVLAPGDQRFASYDWEQTSERLVPLYCGGASRAESVRNGLAAASGIDPDDWVLVHDAARPCLTKTALVR